MFCWSWGPMNVSIGLRESADAGTLTAERHESRIAGTCVASTAENVTTTRESLSRQAIHDVGKITYVQNCG